MKIKILFLEKVKFGKFSTKADEFLGNRWKSETGGKWIIASMGMDAHDNCRWEEDFT